MRLTLPEVIGDLFGPIARLDDDGRVVADDFILEWGVLAGDRWRVGHTERLRRDRLDDTPVHELRMRVPSGDLILRVAAINDGVAQAVLAEFENASAAPVLVAVAGRRDARLEATTDGIAADGDTWVTMSRPAGGVVAGDPIWNRVRDEPGPASAVATGPSAAAAVVMAVPHRQKVSVASGVGGPPPLSWIDAADVAKGWKAVTRKASKLDLPDADMTQAWRRAIADLVVLAGSSEPGTAAAAASRLDLAGLVDEVDRATVTVIAAADTRRLAGCAATEALRLLASRELFAGRRCGLELLAGPLAHGARDCLDRHTLLLTAAALERVFPAGAADARRLATTLQRAVPEPSVVQAAATATAIASHLVADFYDPRAVALLPEVPVAWLGQSLDVEGLCTAAGVVSFAMRWHGSCPALLWERTGGADDVVLTAPGLDPNWVTTSRSGESLLAPT